MFRHDLLHGIYQACAAARKSVHIYEPEIDISGFDIVVDNLFRTLRFQLKSKLIGSATRAWSIHKTLLRPNLECLNSLPFIPGGEGAGYMGGVILIEADITEANIQYSYSYTDVLVICAKHASIFGPSSSLGKAAVTSIFKELVRPDLECKPMILKKEVFWKFSNLGNLLKFAGLSSDVRDNFHLCVSSLHHRPPMHGNKKLSAEASRRLAESILRPLLDLRK